MKTIFMVATLVAAALFVSHTKIEFEPFSITCRYWYRGLGLILFVVGLSLMQAGDRNIGYSEGFKKGVDSVFGLIEKPNKNRTENHLKQTCHDEH